MKHRLALLFVLAACDDPAPKPPAETRIVQVASFPAERVHALDLVFQIDDSGSTAHFQSSLAREIGRLLDALAWDGARPGLHVAVTTSDLGTTGSLDPQRPGPSVGTVGQGGCAGAGDDGAHQDPQDLVAGDFIIDDGAARNYTGELATVIEGAIRVGSTGCGFEQPLAATRRLFARYPDFTRPDAALAIVVIADEDDCSVRDPAFFTPDETALGPLQSFRCTSQGVVCDEPLTDVGPKTNCRSRADSPYVDDAGVFADFFASLKPRLELLSIAAIVGAPTPFAVETRVVNGMPQLALAHSCGWNMPAGPVAADPPTRIAAVVDAFASRGALLSVCQDDLAPQVQQLALTIKRSLGVACIDTAPLADSLAADGVQPACEARDVLADGTLRALPRCPAAGDCFDLVADPQACAESADHARVVVTRAAPAPAGTRTEGTRTEVYCEAPAPMPAADEPAD